MLSTYAIAGTDSRCPTSSTRRGRRSPGVCPLDHLDGFTVAAGQAVEIVEAGSDVLCVRRHESTGAHPDVGRWDKAVGGCDRHFVAEEELHHVVQGEGMTGTGG